MSKLEEEYTREVHSSDFGYDTYTCNTTGKEVNVGVWLDKEDILRYLRYRTLPIEEALLRQAVDAGFSEEEVKKVLSK